MSSVEPTMGTTSETVRRAAVKAAHESFSTSNHWWFDTVNGWIFFYNVDGEEVTSIGAGWICNYYGIRFVDITEEGLDA